MARYRSSKTLSLSQLRFRASHSLIADYSICIEAHGKSNRGLQSHCCSFDSGSGARSDLKAETIALTYGGTL